VRICVADDHDAIREALRELLVSGLGVADVVEATTGDDAVAAARAGVVDLVLMDVTMPGTDGVVATRRIRDQYPRVRVVALTASHDAASVAAMIGAGADSYLVKSAPAEELRASLRKILAGEVVLAAEVLPVVVRDLATRLRAEQDRAEALDALDRIKREFVSLVSDQLRNPLTAITGYTRTLRTGWARVDDSMKQEFLEHIDGQAEQLERRIEQILTVARLEAGGGHRGGASFALDDLARDVVGRRADGSRHRPIETQLETVEVRADRRAISEVVLALVDNALVHGLGRVSVTVRRAGAEAVLEVEDEGPGVEPTVLAGMLDQPFMPGDASDTEPSSGMGLSLYIARRVVENAGGRLELDSAIGCGTLARIRLPALARR
jgi:signal transduction histidine kinase